GRPDRSRVCRGRSDPPQRRPDRLPGARFWRTVANLLAAGSSAVTHPRSSPGEALIMALPNGRILGEVMPLLQRIGIEPEPAFNDPKSRKLRFATSDPGLDLIRVRSFDVATFVAFGAAQLGVAGNDVLMEFD